MRSLGKRGRERSGLAYDLNSYETASLVREIVEERVYAPVGLVLRPSPTVVDVGANVGVFTAFALREWPGAQVVAVEPVPELVKILRKNFAALPSVHIVDKAVGRVSGETSYTYFPEYSMFSGISVDANETVHNVVAEMKRRIGEEDAAFRSRADEDELESLVRGRLEPSQIEVEMITPTELLHKWPRVDLLKLDIEGHEVAFLESMQSEDWARVNIIALEPELSESDHSRAWDVLNLNGFRSHPLNRSGSRMSIALKSM